MGDYDKIIKENIDAIFLPLLEKFTGIRIREASELKDKIQYTIEREPDFTKRVVDAEGRKFILHLEFQTADDPKMVRRMAVYKALLQYKYEIPTKQFVIYLGQGISNMRSVLPEHERIIGFTLKNIVDLSSVELMNSDVPEEILLSILADYPKVNVNETLDRLITRLQRASKDAVALERYLKQLLVLSRLRNLEIETKRKIDKMPITYDISKDGLYQQGIEKAKYQMIVNLIDQNLLTLEQISEVANVSIDEVKTIKKELDKD